MVRRRVASAQLVLVDVPDVDWEYLKRRAETAKIEYEKANRELQVARLLGMTKEVEYWAARRSDWQVELQDAVTLGILK